MLSLMKLKFYIIEICDIDIARKSNPDIDEIIVDGDLQNIQFRDKITPKVKYELDIPCNGCRFEDYEVIMCMDLEKMKVCILFKNEDEPEVFDKGNYAFIMFVDYLNWMYEFKQIDNNKTIARELGIDFELEKGNSGTPAFFNGGYVEASFMMDINNKEVLNLLFSKLEQSVNKDI